MSRKIDKHHPSMPKQNVMQDEFGWEVPIESVPLPSRGVLYDPDTTLYNRETVPIKAMTANEEDILSSPAYIKEGLVIDKLIEACITDRSFNINNLTLGDRNALMIAIRITGYGPEYPISATCSSCSHTNDINVNLSDLAIKRLEIEPATPGKNEFTFTLPTTKKDVIFKFLTIQDENNRAATNKAYKQNFDTKLERNVTSFLTHAVVAVDGNRDKNKIKHFIMNMPAFDSRALRTTINTLEPGMDMTVHYECSNCKSRNATNLPMTSEFFWPGT